MWAHHFLNRVSSKFLLVIQKIITKVNLCSIKCPLYTVGERLGENRIFDFPQKYHVKTTQDSTQMTFGCQIWPRPLFWTSEVTRGRRGHPRSRSNLTSWGQGKSFEYHIWGSRRFEVTRAASSGLRFKKWSYGLKAGPPYMILKWLVLTSGCQIWPRPRMASSDLGSSKQRPRSNLTSKSHLGRILSCFNIFLRKTKNPIFTTFFQCVNVSWI